MWRSEAGAKLRRDRALPQTEIAQRMGVSERWYRSLESGAAVSLTPEVLGRLAEALVLGPDERMVLYSQALGGTSFGVSGGPDPVDPVSTLVQVVEAQTSMPAYLTDRAWNILGHNRLMAEWFPWVTEPGANLIRWALTMPEAREQFVDWRAQVEIYLALLRFALVGNPDDAELVTLAEECLRIPEVREIWDGRTRVVAYRHGHLFRLSLPHVSAEELVVTSQVLVPPYSQGLRCVMVVPRSAADVPHPSVDS
ncbi:helix-turn-helix domain-containing protein [Streptomyces sp. NBC_01233]|uniref:helix-turn-helix domain-containing protein n=1 Tax=Streptomyces sp. NBC_01233 TaxID=2903787 RepID=UPI002E107B9C|nr:helix-turn-helix transcriptional regulator [Streptomyces sp. NBC_01233]